MIKANELRIGNCVKLNNSYTTLVPRDFQRYCKSFGIFEEFEPIELTEKILLSYGFKKRKSCFGFWIYEIIFQNTVFSVEEVDLGLCYFYVGSTHISQTRYVHELQNLYFAITGEELVFSTAP